MSPVADAYTAVYTILPQASAANPRATGLRILLVAIRYVLSLARSQALMRYGPAGSSDSSHTTHWPEMSGYYLTVALRDTTKFSLAVMSRP